MGLLDLPPEEVTGGLLIDSIIAGNWDTFKIGLKHAILPSITLGIFTRLILEGLQEMCWETP